MMESGEINLQRLNREDQFLVQNRTFSSNEIIERLGPCMEEARIARLNEVIEQRSFNVAPVLENIYDRGNVSAVMRSAEAFGYINFHIVEKPEARFKHSNRVSKGTERWMDVQKHESTNACVKELRRQGFKIYCTDLSATHTIDEIDFTGLPTAIVLGNEKDGVSPEMVDFSDGTFILPMAGFAQSFNISVAGALVFYHIFQARKSQGVSGDLSEKEKQILLANYMFRSVGAAEKILLSS